MKLVRPAWKHHGNQRYTVTTSSAVTGGQLEASSMVADRNPILSIAKLFAKILIGLRSTWDNIVPPFSFVVMSLPYALVARIIHSSAYRLAVDFVGDKSVG